MNQIRTGSKFSHTLRGCLHLVHPMKLRKRSVICILFWRLIQCNVKRVPGILKRYWKPVNTASNVDSKTSHRHLTRLFFFFCTHTTVSDWLHCLSIKHKTNTVQIIVNYRVPSRVFVTAEENRNLELSMSKSEVFGIRVVGSHSSTLWTSYSPPSAAVQCWSCWLRT